MTTPVFAAFYGPSAVFGLSAAMIGMVLLLFLMVVGFAIVPAILSYVLLDRIPVEHRKQTPGLALLLLIPVFSVIWAFFVYPRISDSLQSYFRTRNLNIGDCGHSIALATCICSVCSIVPVLGILAGLAGFVLLIVFFVKAFELTGQIPRALPTQPVRPTITPSSPA